MIDVESDARTSQTLVQLQRQRPTNRAVRVRSRYKMLLPRKGCIWCNPSVWYCIFYIWGNR